MTHDPGASAPAWQRTLAGATVVSGTPGDVTDVTHDSRRVRRGALFVAIPGAKADGNDFIAAAVAAGAVAVIVQADRRDRWQARVVPGVAFVAVPDARVALAQAAAGVFGFPARTLGMVGVTGTDGKTTTTHLVAHVLSATGRSAGYLSSVEFSDGRDAELNATHMTTVEASDVQRQLRRIADAVARYAVVEASSIGLELHRVDECAFDVGVFTNLTPDHLDFHGTMDAYLASKRRLFEMVASSPGKGVPKAAVLNADDPASAAMREAAPGARAITYALAGSADLVAGDIGRDALGTAFTLRTRDAEVRAKTPLLGAYNVANCLAAVCVALSQGAPLADAAAALETFPGVPGRMERIDQGQPFAVIVDIASTEPAMRNVLSALRPSTDGRVIVVFGAAGERDRARRSGIARAVAEGADFALIADEDPRSEDPDAIIAEIADALVACGFREGAQFARVPDRREAIRRAFAMARPGDVVLLAGKGTEQAIDMRDGPVPWDERRVARELLGGSAGV